MNCCCNIFEDKLAEVGNEGFSIIASLIAEEEFFFLQARTIEGYAPPVKESVWQMTLKFCPWCGSNLEEQIRLDKAGYYKLLEKHEKFRI